VGAGELTAAIVTGLSAETDDPPEVFLSPRGRGKELSGRFPNVRVCDSNQDVIEHATSIVLAVRPYLGRAVVSELSFRPEHVVISALAGVRLAPLRDWAAQAGRVARVIPLPQAARRRSLTALYPDESAARVLFGQVGDVVVPGGEEALEVFSAATATFAAHLDHLRTIAGWMSDHGVDQSTADAYVRHVFGQLGESLSERTGSLDALTRGHMTPGGINEQFMSALRNDRVPDVVRRALEGVLERLRE
jgi:pyrroline-5-carboxylate reductase